jgi:hypothetical protein
VEGVQFALSGNIFKTIKFKSGVKNGVKAICAIIVDNLFIRTPTAGILPFKKYH